MVISKNAIENMMLAYIDHKQILNEYESEMDEQEMEESANYNFHKGCCETAECWMRAIGVSPGRDYMKYGDIVVYNNQIGTVVKSENDFKFRPVNSRCYFSNLDTITDNDIREATHDEKLELIEKEFTWGNVLQIHCIGEYQIVEYIDKNDRKKYYCGYINYRDTNRLYSSLDSALIGCVGYKHEGGSGKAAMYFEKMLGIDNEI